MELLDRNKMKLLVVVCFCLTLHMSQAFPTGSPDLLLDYDLLDEELGGSGRRNGTGTLSDCGSCEQELCPENRGCRAGLVLDTCGCCQECGNLEGQACDRGDRGRFYGLCGTGLRCQTDPRSGGGGDEEEDVCVCEEQEPVCGSDGTTFLNICQFREAAFSNPDLQTIGIGPCNTVPLIKVPPQNQVNGTGSSLVFLCEVFAFPMAQIEWTKEGRNIVLPGDDPHISVQSRGGPLKFELSSWLQIEGAEPGDSGTYSCTARNNLGSVSASAVLGVLEANELSSFLANSMSEMKDLMENMDYDLESY